MRAGTLLGGRYRLGRRIGSGSAGEVWEASDARGQGTVAVKVLHADLAQDPGIRGRFMAEAYASGRIDHPNVVKVHDFGDYRGAPYMVMELCDGEELDTVIARRGAMGVGYACELTCQVLAALGAAHALGIVHRDLKPANIMVVHPQPDEPLVKVLDFGIAKGVRGEGMDQDEAGLVFGTPEYMAPEQALAEPVDARADLYAVGAMLYHLMAGKPPFVGGDPLEVLTRVVSVPPVPLDEVVPEVPRALAAVVQKALGKTPPERQQSAAELLEALKPFVPAEPRRRLPSFDGNDSLAPLPLKPKADSLAPLLLIPKAPASVRPKLQLVPHEGPPQRLTLVESVPPPPLEDE